MSGPASAPVAVWRPLAGADLDAVVRIAAEVHPGLDERRDVFAEKLRLFPRGCLALGAGGALAGYAFSHPWRLGDAPALDAFLGALPSAPDCLYLHDIAMLPGARGRGAAAAALARLTEIAAAVGLPAMALVSVGTAHGFWARETFVEALLPGLPSRLDAYGDGARYMTKRLGAVSGDDAPYTSISRPSSTTRSGGSAR